MNSSFSQLLLDSFDKYENNMLFQIKRGLKRYRWTYVQGLEEIKKIQNIFKKRSFNQEDKFLLWSPNMPEWAFVFLASIFSGLVMIPIDPKNSPQTVRDYIKKMNTKFIIASRYFLPFIGDIAIEKIAIEYILNEESEKVKIHVFEENNDDVLVELLSDSKIKRKDILAKLEKSSEVVPNLKKYETLSMLPLTDIDEQVYGLILPILKGGTINYLQKVNPLTVKREINRVRPTYLLPVPKLKAKDQYDKKENISFLEELIESLSGKEITDAITLADLGLDSLRRFQLTEEFEEKTGITLDETKIASQTTVSQLKELVLKNKDQQNLYDPDEILNSFKFKHLTSFLRDLFHRFFLYPIHGVYVKTDFINRLDGEMPENSLMIFNHIGMFELICLYKFLPERIRRKTVTMITNERWEDHHPWVCKLLEFCIGGYPIAKEGPALRSGLDVTSELIDKGYSIFFAPEGEMEREQHKLPFMSGLGLLLKELQVPVVMFKISPEYREIWPPPKPKEPAVSSKYFFPRKKGEVTVKIAQADIDTSLSYEELTGMIEKQFHEL